MAKNIFIRARPIAPGTASRGAAVSQPTAKPDARITQTFADLHKLMTGPPGRRDRYARSLLGQMYTRLAA
jgi:hypothetical protein